MNYKNYYKKKPMSFIFIFSLFFISLISTYILIIKIRAVIIFKKLMDDPNERSSHLEAVPNLGGLAFYIVLLLSFYFIESFDDSNLLIALLPGLIILLFVGLKDDLVIISPLTKIFAQLLSALFLVNHSSFHINFHGFLGLETLPIWLSIVIASLIIITVINIINLIDGIDGLATIISIIIILTYSIFFYLIGLKFMFSMCIVLMASLLAFLRFNFSKDSKVFMGDTGSMLLGFIIGAFTVRFLSLNQSQLSELPFNFKNIPLIAFFILIIPLFDTARVIIIRLVNGKSPFSADRNHIHHLLLDYYCMSHMKISLYIGIFQLISIISFLFLSLWIPQWLLLCFFFCSIICSIIYFFLIQKKFKTKIQN